ncbi:MAG: Serine/threonine-protein kinase [Chaenotheca gracillima]|nr:MAG: Serine/threonine-protein kinase [Chaenotheca gracillima]
MIRHNAAHVRAVMIVLAFCFDLFVAPTSARAVVQSSVDTSPVEHFLEKRATREMFCAGLIPYDNRDYPPGWSSSNFEDVRDLCRVGHTGCGCSPDGKKINCNPNRGVRALHDMFRTTCKNSCLCVQLFKPDEDVPPETVQLGGAKNAIMSNKLLAELGNEQAGPSRKKPGTPGASSSGTNQASNEVLSCPVSSCSSFADCPSSTETCGYTCKSQAYLEQPFMWLSECAVSYGWRKRSLKERDDRLVGVEDDVGNSTGLSGYTLYFEPNGTVTDDKAEFDLIPCPCNCTYVSTSCCDTSLQGLVIEGPEQWLGRVAPPDSVTCCDLSTGHLRAGIWEDSNGTCADGAAAVSTGGLVAIATNVPVNVLATAQQGPGG